MLSVPYSKGRSLQHALTNVIRRAVQNLSVPYSKGRSLQRGWESSCRHRERLSVPYSKGRSLQLDRVFLIAWAGLSFSPLFQGSVTATVFLPTPSEPPGRLSVPYSKGRSLQLFVRVVTRRMAVELSVPYSKGRSLQLSAQEGQG